MSARLTLFVAAALAASPAFAADANRYTQTNFVANKAQYKPQLKVEPKMVNAWGIANRPAGAGGHFWITARDISYQYVGDVSASADESLRKLKITDVPYVKLPVGGNDNFSTSVVFLDSKKDFVITQSVDGAAPVTAPAKFLFASDGGIISAWTERKKEDGTFDRSDVAIPVIDQSKSGAQYFGLAASSAYDKIYAVNFGQTPGIEVFGGDFKQLPILFDMPFDGNKNGKVDAGEYAPFNIQNLNGRIFVAYAKTRSCPAEEVKKGTCKEGEIFAGEEDTSKPGHGHLAEFSENGKLVAVWNDGGKLSAPWGMAFAPEGFGALAGKLLVANFGDGTIAAYDTTTRQFADVLRDEKGNPVKIDKIWGLLFGNGASLGDKDALYFTAGPNDETDGVFGVLRVAR